MNTITDIWTTPPERQGHGVEVSYRYAIATDRIWRRKIDRSDGTTSYASAHCPEGEDCEFWNGAPSVPRADWVDENPPTESTFE